MSTTPTARKGNARQAFIGQGFIPAGYELGKKMSEFFPKEGKIKALVGVSAPGQNWSEQRAAGVMKFLEEFKAANSGREVVIERLDTGTDGAVVADRVGAYLSANPDTTVYFDTGLWHAYVAQVLVDRGVEPGKVLMGGFDIVARGPAADGGRLHPGAGRPAALHAGLHAGDGSILVQDHRPGCRPTSTPARASCSRKTCRS